MLRLDTFCGLAHSFYYNLVYFWRPSVDFIFVKISSILTKHCFSQDATHNYTSDASPKTPSAKPRGVRRKWGFHFGGSKTGSLKSLKSMKSASSSRENLENMESSPSSKLGPMMLATLHGLTRSRPDLLLESMTTFSAFTTPSRYNFRHLGNNVHIRCCLVIVPTYVAL